MTNYIRRKIFFSFYYIDRDLPKISQIRNCHALENAFSQSPFLDKADWEKVKLPGEQAIKKWIDDQMLGTSVTIVLIAPETCSRPWIQYEIKKSWDEGKGLFGISMAGMKGWNTSNLPWANWNNISDPFLSSNIKNPRTGLATFTLFDKPPIYNWITEDGYNNIGQWINTAIFEAEKRTKRSRASHLLTGWR
ncbi:MAG TPA: TIR domain-containing protein [Alphaproteobacteria bacterium]|nr:TIR domain-containing protein [Alphaproteobacteria bacterium]